MIDTHSTNWFSRTKKAGKTSILCSDILDYYPQIDGILPLVRPAFRPLKQEADNVASTLPHPFGDCLRLCFYLPKNERHGCMDVTRAALEQWGMEPQFLIASAVANLASRFPKGMRIDVPVLYCGEELATFLLLGRLLFDMIKAVQRPLIRIKDGNKIFICEAGSFAGQQEADSLNDYEDGWGEVPAFTWHHEQWLPVANLEKGMVAYETIDGLD